MTETQTLEALLRRWAELEPEWAKHAQALIPNPDDYSVGAWAHAGMFCIVPIQEAIEERGWRTTLEYYLDPVDGLWKWRATVREPENDAYDQKAAAALLSAYLQALEARA